MAISQIPAASAVSGTLPAANLPTGSVLQVVNATYSTETTTASSTFADSGLTATITPKFSTSKILVLAQLNGIYRDQGGATYLAARLLRNSTNILNFESIAAYLSVPANGSTGVGGISTSYLDSPATTSATIYKIQIASGGNVAMIRINAPASGNAAACTITLMEIAA
jgi:hypothetical protein